MTFPWILVFLLNGDPLTWAGFQTKEDCMNVKHHIKLVKGMKATCVPTVKADK